MGVALKELPVVSLTEAPTAGFFGVSVMSRQAPRISLEEGGKLECRLPLAASLAFYFLGFDARCLCSRQRNADGT